MLLYSLVPIWHASSVEEQHHIMVEEKVTWK